MPIADEGPGYRHGQMPQGSSHPSQAYNFHGGTGLKSIQEEDSPMFATPEPKRRRFEDARSRLSDTPVPSGVSPGPMGMGGVIAPAPLHTQFAPFHDAYETPILTGDKSYDSQEEGVVAMVMSVPHMRKMHIISQIAPPYRTKDPVNNKSMTRGCFIVVEGPVDATLKAVGAAVERALRGYEEETALVRRSGPGLSKIPVALAPKGFSVTCSDRFACSIPIEDAYAPTEHWQWMATQWRGMVGPDLFVYVKPTADPGINLRNTVELKSPNVMLVRVPMEGTLDEKTERRLAFEIVEWVRGGHSQRL
ncbi:unnamed protein product [Parascedosporium putredinis]|uniref:Uncharacterized protein n=1 Tax=Parascedosporium putredinis TaxID=1442378 RepID=A0A9P1GXK0_9PEZI|nr:unnamed protein product [Parascedosporium putredinis]CAI7989062.1 unnamed protein product [Parascedosporium putredinis]